MCMSHWKCVSWFCIALALAKPGKQTLYIRIHLKSRFSDMMQHKIHLDFHHHSNSKLLFCFRGLRALLTGLSFIICPCGMPCCPWGSYILTDTHVFTRVRIHTHQDWAHLTFNSASSRCFPPLLAVNCNCLPWHTLKLTCYLDLISVSAIFESRQKKKKTKHKYTEGFQFKGLNKLSHSSELLTGTVFDMT